MAAFRVYENELIGADDQDANRVPFQAFTLESFIDALAEAGASGLARDLWGPYSDFERVYHLSLGEYLKNPSSHTLAAPLALPNPTDGGAVPKGKNQNDAQASNEEQVAEGPSSVSMEVSIIWTAASWAAARASMIPLQTPALRQRTKRL